MLFLDLDRSPHQQHADRIATDRARDTSTGPEGIAGQPDDRVCTTHGSRLGQTVERGAERPVPLVDPVKPLVGDSSETTPRTRLMRYPGNVGVVTMCSFGIGATPGSFCGEAGWATPAALRRPTKSSVSALL